MAHVFDRREELKTLNRPAIVLIVSCLSLTGCGVRPQSKGVQGAASVAELVERYKEAHRKKDIAALRAIYVHLSFGTVAPLITGSHFSGARMVGDAERQMPKLFDFDLRDVELVDVPRDESGRTWLDYMVKTKRVKGNGFSAVNQTHTYFSEPYKFLLIGRRVQDPHDSTMELDPCLGVSEYDGRFYVYASDSELEAVANWVQSGHLPPIYRSPDHKPISLRSRPDKVPDNFVRIVRPRK